MATVLLLLARIMRQSFRQRTNCSARRRQFVVSPIVDVGRRALRALGLPPRPSRPTTERPVGLCHGRSIVRSPISATTPSLTSSGVPTRSRLRQPVARRTAATRCFQLLNPLPSERDTSPVRDKPDKTCRHRVLPGESGRSGMPVPAPSGGRLRTAASAGLDLRSPSAAKISGLLLVGERRLQVTFHADSSRCAFLQARAVRRSLARIATRHLLAAAPVMKHHLPLDEASRCGGSRPAGIHLDHHQHRGGQRRRPGRGRRPGDRQLPLATAGRRPGKHPFACSGVGTVEPVVRLPRRAAWASGAHP